MVMEKNRKVLLFISFMLIMIVMGASDSLRGLFGMVFQEHFHLTNTQVSMIITVSYLGNLVFLFFGGYFLDTYPKKKVFLAVLGIWMTGALLFLLTENYVFLLAGMFLCMGASTLLNTTINILVPVVYAASPGLIVNVLFFVQGIGTSGSQNVIGRYSADFSSWKTVNLLLFLLAIGGAVLFSINELPQIKKEKEVKVSYGAIMKTRAFLFLTLLFGTYFIAEHGVLNWLMMYGTKELSFDNGKAAGYLSVFFAGMTIGRLVFAPVVQRIGVSKSIGIFSTGGMILYVAGIASGSRAFILLSLSGFSLSIVYPTLILMIRNFYEEDRIARATGAIISLATICDIAFNIIFGKLIDKIGLGTAFIILPASLVIFWILYLVFVNSVKTTHQEFRHTI